MQKQKTQEQKVNETCVCGEEGQSRYTRTLKDGTTQQYCSQECMSDDSARQQPQQGEQGKQQQW